MNNFLKKWQGKAIRDDGAYNSRHFNSFAKELKTLLASESSKNGITLKKFTVGHYCVSGFLAVGENAHVYFSYNVPRGEMPMNLTAKDARNGFLLRTAMNDKDCTGGNNHFTDLSGFFTLAIKLLAKELNAKQRESAA